MSVGSLPTLSPRAEREAADGRTFLARLFHALSDETRLRIVGQLLAGEQCVCDLTEALDAQQSRLSFHLRALKDAGLVLDRRDGRWVHYSLNPEALDALAGFGAALKERRPKGWLACCR
jgi:ArsR family transcriptional regulator